MTILGALRRAGRSGLAAYFAAGDPDPEASLALLRPPAAGADVIELGMPFSDPWPTARSRSRPMRARWLAGRP